MLNHILKGNLKKNGKKRKIERERWIIDSLNKTPFWHFLFISKLFAFYVQFRHIKKAKKNVWKIKWTTNKSNKWNEFRKKIQFISSKFKWNVINDIFKLSIIIAIKLFDKSHYWGIFFFVYVLPAVILYIYGRLIFSRSNTSSSLFLLFLLHLSTTSNPSYFSVFRYPHLCVFLLASSSFPYLPFCNTTLHPGIFSTSYFQSISSSRFIHYHHRHHHLDFARYSILPFLPTELIILNFILAFLSEYFFHIFHFRNAFINPFQSPCILFSLLCIFFI